MANPEVETGYAVSDEYRIYYEQHGQGAPMILVHGWGADTQSNWKTTGWIDALAPHRRVVSIDIRGHGLSDKPYADAPYSYAAMSRDVLAVMDHLELQKADFLGYSLGAFVGAYLVGHAPDRFNSMVLGGIGDETDQSAAQGAVIAEALLNNNPEDEAGRQVRRFFSANPNNDLTALAHSARQMWPEGYPLKLAGSGIVQATLPVLVINGSDDLPYVLTARNFVEALPGGVYQEIPDRDHLSVVGDPRFKQAVIEFLLKVGAAGH